MDLQDALDFHQNATFFCLFSAVPTAYGAVTYTTAHGNTGSLTTEQGQGLNPCPHVY